MHFFISVENDVSFYVGSGKSGILRSAIARATAQMFDKNIKDIVKIIETIDFQFFTFHFKKYLCRPLERIRRV